MSSSTGAQLPLALCIQPACLEHKYIRHANSSHIFERPERLRAVLLGFAAALSRLESADVRVEAAGGDKDDLASMLSSLSIANGSPFPFPSLVHLLAPPPLPITPGQILLHHPALQLAHSPPEPAPYPYLPNQRNAPIPSSPYLRDLYKWASNAVETIKNTGCEIPDDMGLNPGDLYLGPGSIVAIEGSIQTVCQAVDGVCSSSSRPVTPNGQNQDRPSTPGEPLPKFSKAFCAIRPPGHHCGEDAPSGFCYVNNVVVGALHAYVQHDIDRAIIIDFDLHHGNGTQALVMPLNAAAYAEDLALEAGKPPTEMRGRNGTRRSWKGFYGSVHDIYSYPCEDGDLDLVKDASLSLAAHGQYIENIHLQPYASEEDFYERIYPKYLALLEKSLVFMKETDADPERTVLFISAGFDACEHEHQGMQRHDRRVPVSFYSRYTRDLVAFADKHMLGKVVSVLEGGYGDRALTSAAMGHAIGLLGREGVPDWWTVDELELLERAVKKRRKGKLVKLSADLAANPHIARTHALLNHMEGAAPPETPAPSVTATPQAPRTLRTRRTIDADSDSPRPRLRGKATPTATPLRKHADPEIYMSPDPVQKSGAYLEQAPPISAGTVPVILTAGLGAGPDAVTAAYPSPGSENASPSDIKAEPIILRIPKMTPSPSVSPPREVPTTPTPSGSAAPQVHVSAAQPVPAAFAAQLAAPSPAQPRSAPIPTQSAPAPAPPMQKFFRPQSMQSVVLPPTPVRVPTLPSYAPHVPPVPNFNPSPPLERIIPNGYTQSVPKGPFGASFPPSHLTQHDQKRDNNAT